jgi:hypothetical protein
MNLYEHEPSKGSIEIVEPIVSVHTKKAKVEIPIVEISAIGFVYNKSILYLVIGGILAPLAGVGFVKGILNPWLALIYIVAGVIVFYYGWQGRSMIQIHHGFHKKLIISVDDDQRRWFNFIAAFREIRALY